MRVDVTDVQEPPLARDTELVVQESVAGGPSRHGESIGFVNARDDDGATSGSGT